MSGQRDLEDEDLHVEDESDEDLRSNAADTDEDLDLKGQEPDEIDEDRDAQGSDDALGGSDAPTGQGPAEVRPQSRAASRIQRLANEAKEAKATADAALRELQEFRQRSQPNQADLIRQRRDAELKQAQEAGDTNAYYEARLRHQNEDTNFQIGQLRFETADTNDRSNFAALCARRPELAGLSDEVENQLRILRSQGGNAQREVVAKFLLGDRAFNRAAANKTRATKKAEIDRNRERSTPARGSGDVTPSRQKGGNESVARANRLKDLNI